MRTEKRDRLCRRFIALSAGPSLHPLPIQPKRNKAKGDDEHNAKHQDHSRVLAGPVAAFGHRVNAGDLRALNSADGSHCRYRERDSAEFHSRSV